MHTSEVPQLEAVAPVSAGVEDTGLEVLDLHSDESFGRRRLHTRDLVAQVEGMQRIARAFVTDPDTILQELVNAAVEICGADSAGISIEDPNATDANAYYWVAVAGLYTPFLNAMLPRSPSACGTCLERNRPQLLRVRQRFFDLLAVDAATVTDGILLPWKTEQTRGTIWILAHGRHEAFDGEDCRMMQVLADFAAMGVRQQNQQKLLVQQAGAAAATAMANTLAHEINNPLQSLTNLVYLATHGEGGGDAKTLGLELSGHLQRLSGLVNELLALPSETGRKL